MSDVQVAQVIERTLNTTPKDATHWSIRSMAAEVGLSHTTIRRIWGAFGLQQHRSETFKLSTDPLFVDKVQDIVGLYLSPPNRAVVLCVDEKSQIQALDREQPVLPMAPGIPERRTHTYVRNGATSIDDADCRDGIRFRREMYIQPTVLLYSVEPPTISKVGLGPVTGEVMGVARHMSLRSHSHNIAIVAPLRSGSVRNALCMGDLRG